MNRPDSIVFYLHICFVVAMVLVASALIIIGINTQIHIAQHPRWNIESTILFIVIGIYLIARSVFTKYICDSSGFSIVFIGIMIKRIEYAQIQNLSSAYVFGKINVMTYIRNGKMTAIYFGPIAKQYELVRLLRERCLNISIV